jgi:hypothetical protein
LAVLSHDRHCPFSGYTPQLVLYTQRVELILVEEIKSQKQRNVHVNNVDKNLDMFLWTWNWYLDPDFAFAFGKGISELED